MSAIRTQIMLDSPVGYWPLENGSLLDVSGNGRHLTLGSTALTPAVGLGWNCSEFNNGSSQWAYTDLSTAFTPNNVTYEFWAYRISGSSVYSPFTVASTGGASPITVDTYGVGGGGQWRAYLSANGTSSIYQDVYGPAVVTNGRWYYLVFTYDQGSNTFRFYLDGVLVSTDTTSSGTRDQGNYRVWFGRFNSDYTQLWPGRLAHGAVYNTVLSADRINAHYAAGIRGGVVI